MYFLCKKFLSNICELCITRPAIALGLFHMEKLFPQVHPGLTATTDTYARVGQLATDLHLFVLLMVKRDGLVRVNLELD